MLKKYSLYNTEIYEFYAGSHVATEFVFTTRDHNIIEMQNMTTIETTASAAMRAGQTTPI